ncbi:hypothetical protein ZWY2020_034615 [Hordeum vulgare]|nr:hypothetical protein ZWY2020_034615 [Hordeum vulgare]
MDFKLPEKIIEEEESEFIPIFSELKSLTNNGLIGIDLFRCWIEWNILPLSQRDGLMYEYDGTVDHPQCFNRKRLSENEIFGIIKKQTGETLEECAKIGLKAFYRANPVPPVRIQAAFRFSVLINALGMKFTSIHQKHDPFWRRGPKVTAQKTTKPPPKSKKKASKSKAATKDSSFVGESQADEVLSEGEDNESQDDVVEDSVIQTESALTDLRKNMADQQDAHSELEWKYRLIQAELEKMKVDQKKLEKKAKADQTAIIKCAEQAEEKVEPAQQELSVLKKHVSNMIVAMFGARAANLPDDCMLKLKAIYTFAEQLLTGGMLTIKAVMGSKEPVAHARLFVYISSSDRGTEKFSRPKGSIEHPELMLSLCPGAQTRRNSRRLPRAEDDGSEFTEVDYHRVIIESRYAATQLAANLYLSKYQAAYDKKKQKVTPPSYETASLVPRRPKNPFDLDMDLSLFLDDEDEFVALSKCNWNLGDLRIEGGESSRQGDSAAA